jgi:demethoxyubiquinone hydroxylase (CLK1/Coq7/Cat5 family)
MSDETSHGMEQTIRRGLCTGDIRLRAAGATPAQLRAVRRTLRATNRLETMAVQVYRAQWSAEPTELNRQLVAAMDNELTHQADSLSRLMEYGGRPMLLRAPFYVVGWVLGRVSRMLGLRAMLRLGAWVEAKAIDHYAHLTAAVDWDPATHDLLVGMWNDEKCHHRRWTYLLEHPQEATAPAREPPASQ